MADESIFLVTEDDYFIVTEDDFLIEVDTVTVIPNTILFVSTPGIAEYRFLIKDHAGNLIQHITAYKTAMIKKVVNGEGVIAVTLFENDPLIDLLSADASQDYIIEIKRRNPSVSLDWYLYHEGFLFDFTDSRDDKARNFTAIGGGYLDLLRRRNIRRPTLGLFKAGTGETVIKELVQEEAGAGSTTGNGRITFGATAGLIVEADQLRGLAGAWSMELKDNLLDAVGEIATQTIVDFDVVGIGPAAFEFRVYGQQRGLDRRLIGVDSVTGFNSAGNIPMVFSFDRNNISSATSTRDVASSKNAVLTLGGGKNQAQLYDITQDFVASSISPWGIREIITNASNGTEPSVLASISAATLQKAKVVNGFSFSVLQQAGSYYGKDYGFGDYVSAIDAAGRLRHVRMREAVVRLSPEGPSEDLTFVFEEL